MFAHYVDAKRTLISITSDDVLRFFAYDAGKGQVERRASKTIELHGTAVRAFFVALQEAKVLTVNPAQHVFPTKGQSPLPEYLFPGQADQLKQAARRLAADEDHPKPRPHLLLILMLDLGLRLMEVEALKVGDIDATDAAHPIVYVRPTDRRHFAKRRGMNAPTELVEALKQYQQAYAIREGRLFPVDRKVLKEDVAALGRAVELPVRLSPERLRWTYALTQFRAGVADDRLQKQLGLSPLGWEDARKKLERMARPACEGRPPRSRKDQLQNRSGATVSILIAEATEMRALDVFDLAQAHEVNMIMDGRCNHERDALSFERVLGPCYTRLLDSPRAKGLYIDKVTSVANTWRGLTSTILILADTGQAEQLAALVKDACKTCVQVRLVENGSGSTGRQLATSDGLN